MAKVEGFPRGVKMDDLEPGELFAAFHPEGNYFGVKVVPQNGVGAMILGAPDGFETPHLYGIELFPKVYRLPYDARIEPAEPGLPKPAQDLERGTLTLDPSGRAWMHLSKMGYRADFDLETGEQAKEPVYGLQTNAWRIVGRDGDRVIEFFARREPVKATVQPLKA